MATLRALVLSTHPGPGAAVTIIAVTFGISLGLEPWRLVALAIVAILGQASVGLSNDWRDAARDRRTGRTDKPIVRGEVAASTVGVVAIVCLTLSIAAGFVLSCHSGVVHAIAIASAWCYNLTLKTTSLSVLPYVVSFGLLPAVVSLALEPPRLPPPEVFAAGMLLGVAAHFANVAPDRDDDLSTGVVGLPHRLNKLTNGIVITSSLSAGTVLLVMGSPLPTVWAIGVSSLLLALVGGVSVVLARGSRWTFRIVVAAAVLDVVLLAVRLQS